MQSQCYNDDRFGPIYFPPHLGKIATDLHRFTWYTLNGSNHASKTNRGTWKAGFKANLDKGKTECVANYRGAGAPRARYETFVQNGGQLSLQLSPGVGGPNVSLQVVGLYTHLGTCFGQDLNMKGEVRRRIGQAQTSFRLLQKSIFRNKRISCRTRFQLLESLACTKLFYNIGVWGQLTPGLARKLEHIMVGWFRQIAGDGFWNEDTTKDEMFLRLWEIPTLQVRLAVAQLRFCLAAYHHAKDTVWEFIKLEADTSSTSWFNLLREALRWYQTILPSKVPAEIDMDTITPSQLEEWFQGAQKPTKANLRILLRIHLLQERLICRGEGWIHESI